MLYAFHGFVTTPDLETAKEVCAALHNTFPEFGEDDLQILPKIAPHPDLNPREQHLIQIDSTTFPITGLGPEHFAHGIKACAWAAAGCYLPIQLWSVLVSDVPFINHDGDSDEYADFKARNPKL